MKQEAAIMNHREGYRCIHCEGIASVLIIKHTEKGTWPEIEFCPFCGSTDIHPVEFADEHDIPM
jgi:hypothetical protein